MINFKLITQALETILKENLYPYYTIERNPIRPEDSSKAFEKKGWIGIYRDKIDYETHSTGDQPYLAMIDVAVEVQTASLTSQEDAEDKLCDAEKEVIDVLKTNKKIGGTVDMTNGYTVEYEMNEKEQTYYQSAIITIHAEARTG